MDKPRDEVTDQVTMGSWRMPRLEEALVAILERSLFVDGSSRVQSQVAEQYKKIQALSLGRGKNLVLDFARARTNRLGPRRVKKQFVVRPRKPAELLVKGRKAMTRQPNHRTSKARKLRIAARILRERPARRQTIEIYDFFLFYSLLTGPPWTKAAFTEGCFCPSRCGSGSCASQYQAVTPRR